MVDVLATAASILITDIYLDIPIILGISEYMVDVLATAATAASILMHSRNNR